MVDIPSQLRSLVQLSKSSSLDPELYESYMSVLASYLSLRLAPIHLVGSPAIQQEAHESAEKAVQEAFIALHKSTNRSRNVALD